MLQILKTFSKKVIYFLIFFYILGATEVFGTFSGFNFNMPAYGGEIQACSLGIDIQCFDEEGKY